MNKRYLILIASGLVLIGIFVFFIFFGGKEDVMTISQESAVAEKDIQETDTIASESNQAESVEATEPANIPEDEIKEESEEPVETKSQPKKEIEEKDPEKNTSSFDIKNDFVSTGFSPSSVRKIDTIIIHSSYNSLGGDEYDVDKIIDIYKSYGVAAHYIIGREGEIRRLVDEKNVAYHAGVSEVPDGRGNVNDFSIGIEMVGNKTDGYTDKQYEAVSNLVDDIKNRYEIKYVLGHKDIAPGRKDDPWEFDFDKLK